jgi:predicted MFS family arabinose efflux permease
MSDLDATAAAPRRAPGYWAPLMLLGAAQFAMVLDTTVMNVSITQLVEDLDSSVRQMQAAITAYTLVMAAFMLPGAKIGDIIGRKRALILGLLIYGTGSLITALAQNMAMLYVGWSLIEGLGAVLVIPAIAALIVSNYEGRDRALAYGVLGGVAAAGAALGPLIGGWFTTYLSWRFVFAGGTGIVIVIALLRNRVASPPPPEHRPRLDLGGTALAALGLATIVGAILMSGAWGWVLPRSVPEFGGQPFAPLGVSPVLWMLAAGMLVLWAFEALQDRRMQLGKDPLLDVSLLSNARLRVGLASLMAMQMLILGLFFVLPVFLQTVIGLDAFQTGVRLLPLSLAMFLAAVSGPRLGTIWAPRRIVWAGLLSMLAGVLVMIGVVDVTLRSAPFAASLVLFGAGAGLLASQIGNVIMSSVDRSRSSEAGGLQGTAQNLGASLGTALVGSVLIASLGTTLLTTLRAEPRVSQDVVTRIEQLADDGVPLVSLDQARRGLETAGLPAEELDAVVDSYSLAQLAALRNALAAIALLALAGFWMSRRLPSAAEQALPDTAP